MLASSRGHYEIVKWLLDKGAEVNHQNKVSYCNYFTSMHMMACDLYAGCWHWNLFQYGLHAQCSTLLSNQPSL